MMQVRSGQRYVSAVCATSIVVVKGPSSDIDLKCGGTAMVAAGTDVDSRPGPAAGYDQGTIIGKRYWDEKTGLEVVCTSAGPGSLSLGDRVLPERPPQPLPSSD
ncbi:hypothetical protein LQ384_20620 [Rhodococcus rhodochrous]|uniref:Uncharacterized protein n=1 Tax=Rhodococcus rhodochrous TaxID=1829 RepID=A0AAW4XKW7_RHORH|nr:hypothetical protein [Rhodococcus rhodochrous]MCD2113519.1 hypothetical protein [Rhodococcus rhodochrous]